MDNEIFLIEKGWINPLENRDTEGYEPFVYTNDENVAKKFCESNGFWTPDDCWAISYIPGRKMWKYKYSKIKLLQEV